MKKVQLGDIAEIVAGQAAPKDKDMGNSGYPFIRAGHLADLIESDKIKSIPKVDSILAKKKKLKLLPEGTILFAKSGMSATKNRVYKLSQQSYFVSHLAGVLPSNNYDSGFLSYFLSWYKPSRLIADPAYPSIKLSDIARIQVPLPTLSEQKRIATILDKADALLQKNKQLLAAYDELLQSTFLDMFGDPVTNPKGWEQKKLSDVIKIKHGFAFKSEYFANEDNYILLTPGNFHEEGGFRENKKQKFYSNTFPEEYILKPKDMLLAMTEQAFGLLGSALFVPKEGIYLHNQRLGLVSYLKKISPTFLYYFFNHSSTRQQIQKTATGTKVRHTSPDRILQIQTTFPPTVLQNKFAQIVENVEVQKTILKQSIQESEDLFNGLVQKAFKGELNEQ